MNALLFLACVAYSQGFLFVQQTCFPQYGLGCYNNSYPFNNSLGALPVDPGTKFQLYTRESKETGYPLKYRDPDSIQASPYKGSRDTKIIIHGYTEKEKVYDLWMPMVKDAILKKEDVNVILVYYPKSAQILYNQAVASGRVVSDMVAEQIKALNKVTGNSPGNFHVTGMSLGAQIAGGVGRALPGIRRITGLDPAGPLFVGMDKAVKLDQTDALFVDVIHTDTVLLGTRDESGHADFYPNGGKKQPPCLPIAGGLGCDHVVATYYYYRSINDCQFRATSCDSYENFSIGRCGSCGTDNCTLMGYGADQANPLPSGKFFLKIHLGDSCVTQNDLKMFFEAG